VGLIFSLAVRSLRNRLLTTVLTLISIALSIALLVGVENVRVGIRESFSNTIRGTDLIVGPRSSGIQILLYSVFGMGTPLGNNMSHESYEYWKNHPAVAWTIPYSLGDSHRGFRVIGTTDDFYEHYTYRRDGRVEFAEGYRPVSDLDVVLGSEVAERLRYAMGSKIAVTHGLGEAHGIMDHDEHPFVVVGILKRTFTPIDRSIYVTLAGVHAMHEGWENGVPPSSLSGMPGAVGAASMPGSSAPPSTPGASAATKAPEAAPAPRNAGSAGLRPDSSSKLAAASERNLQSGLEHAEGEHAQGDHEETQITAFFLAAKSRPTLLRLQREINTWTEEPLSAVIPAVMLQELWHGFETAEKGLRVITFFVVAVGLLGMLVSLYSSLSARRREMAILRAIGASPRRIISLLVLESGMMSVAGSVAGVAAVYVLLLIGAPIAESQFGLHIPIRPLGRIEYLYIGIVCATGFLIGFVPAVKAYRNTLADGLSVKV
jgi:putative ABC transport system permease protein